MTEPEPKPTGRTMAVVVRKFMASGMDFDSAVKAAEARVFGYELGEPERAILVQALKRAGVGV